MKTPTDNLPNDITEIKKTVLALQSKCDFLEEQFRLVQQKQIGKSSELHNGQGDLFYEVEQISDEWVEPEKESISCTRNKPKRQPLPQDLPRELVVHDIPEAVKICD